MKKYLYAFLFLSSTAFAQTQDVPKTNYIQTVVMIGILVLFFYFIILRPEQKRRKKMQEQRASIKKGDKVTAMGILGTVDKITENTIILKMVDGSKIEFMKAAVTEVHPSEPAKKEKKENKEEG